MTHFWWGRRNWGTASVIPSLERKDKKTWKVQNFPKLRWFWTSLQQPVLPLSPHILNREGQRNYSSLAATTDEVESNTHQLRQNSPNTNHGEAGRLLCVGCLRLLCNQWREIGTLTDESPPPEVSRVGGMTHPWGGPLHGCSQDPRS